jgi:Zn-finger nucleic acid-binding protein
MDCPVCNHSLEAMKFQYLPFLACKECRGIWVETKMLRHLATRLAAEKDIKPNKLIGLGSRTPLPKPKGEPVRLCPQCGKGMKKANYAYDSNVFIDRCDTCDCIWLDKGEMERLAAHYQIDEKAVMIGRDLIKNLNEPEELIEYLSLAVTVIYILMRLMLRI